MSNRYNWIIFLGILILTACSKESETDKKVEFKWTEEAETWVSNGMDAPREGGSYSLGFTTNADAEPKASTNAEWLTATVMSTSEKLIIKVDANDKTDAREGVVSMYADGMQVDIKVRQRAGTPQATTDQTAYRQSAEGGDLVVNVKANGELTAELYPLEGEWAKISKLTRGEKPGEYQITVSMEENSGLGRITALYLKVDGEHVEANGELGPSIVQEPAPFGEHVVVEASDEGMLPVLLGSDRNNLRRIRSLVLATLLNKLDFQVLKQLFVTNAEEAASCPVDIDLSRCRIRYNNKNPFKYYGWQPELGEYTETYMPDEIPTGIFTDAANLRSIVLPQALNIIGRAAFKGCTALTSVKIPNYVEEIMGRAFLGCKGLKELDLSRNVCLKALGGQALATGSRLKELYVPFTLDIVASDAFLGCTASAIHLRWLSPMEVKIIPKTEECTLFVPKGTLELYRNTPNWNRFTNMVEEEVEYEEQ